MELKEQKCEACQVGAPKVSPEERKELLSQIEGWTIITETKETTEKFNNTGAVKSVTKHVVDKLFKVYGFNKYSEAVKFTNEVAALAETEGHHPTISLEWGEVGIWWWTHKIEGLHKNDFICASKTDEIREKYKNF